MNIVVVVVEGDEKAPFSIATTPRGRRGHNSFPWMLHFTLDTYLILPSVKQGGIKYHFKVFGMTWPGIKPRCPGPLLNTLILLIYIYIYIYISSITNIYIEYIYAYPFYIYIYIYMSILVPVKPEFGVIPSGQEIIHEWILSEIYI